VCRRTFVRPFRGSLARGNTHPGLAPWAKFCRPNGAEGAKSGERDAFSDADFRQQVLAPGTQNLEPNWLGGLDSNQGSMLQRHVSYHWTTSQQQWKVTVNRQHTLLAASRQSLLKG
jgi:hypothetical protein